MFTEGVGRALAFSGTAIDDSANETLLETIDRLPQSRIAIHAAAAMARPLARDFKVLEIPETSDGIMSVAEAGGVVRTRSAHVEQALALAEASLTTPAAAESLGHIRMHELVDSLTEDVAREGAGAEAASMQREMGDVFARRGVLARVVADVEAKASELAPKRTRVSSRSTAGGAKAAAKKAPATKAPAKSGTTASTRKSTTTRKGTTGAKGAAKK